jgi:hypothetical protein
VTDHSRVGPYDPGVSENAGPGRFSLPLCLAGAVLLGLSLVFGLVTGYFLAWGIGEEDGGPVATAAAWAVLATFVVYVLAVAPMLWCRARSAGVRLAVLAPHVVFVAVAAFGYVKA